jgi:hypothetical protein
MSRYLAAVRLLAFVLLAGAPSGCVVEQGPPPPPPDTEIGFDAITNFGPACNGQLTDWQVTDRNDHSTLSAAGCNQTITFGALQPDAEYTFDIVGYSGSQLCWQGACTVPTASGILTFGDCHASIQALCGH